MVHWKSLLAACLLAGPAAAANLGVMPVAIDLAAAAGRTSVSIVNHGQEAVTMQAETIAWQRVNGADRHEPTADLMVNPEVFTVEPGQTQIIRVGMRKRMELS